MGAIRFLCLLPLAFALFATQNPYHVTNLVQTDEGISALLEINSSLRLRTDVIQTLSLNITYYNENTCQIFITDANNARWEPPIEIFGKAVTKTPNFDVKIQQDPVSIQITRKSDGYSVFNMAQTAMFIFNDHDINFVNEFDNEIGIYGIGERVSSFNLVPGRYTMWARDCPDPYDDGQCGGNCQTYGVHPFYLALAATGSASGGYLLNSNANDAWIAEKSITFRFIGGLINYFVFIGPTPADVVAQYHAILGPPTLMPYWGMGWHQCRYGYHTLEITEEVVSNYTANNLPLDVMWNDIDYMDEYLNWTADPVRFPPKQFKSWIEDLHSQGKHYMCITDAAVGKKTTTSTGAPYDPWLHGLQEEIWIVSPHTGGPFVGKVWPGPACWVDYFHPNAESYWVTQFENFYEEIPIDGVWLDMNEPSNFCNGECGYPEEPFPLDYLPGGVDLNSKTLDLRAIHYGDSQHIGFNTHSMFGFMEGRATNAWFAAQGKRPMIIGRSTFPTSGRYQGHWLGDNTSTWDYMAWSIQGVFDFQMFGIPLVGADICGFIGNTTEELCLRWMQLGTMYPFSRNHNTINAISQEPYAFGPAMTAASEQAIRLKYSILNYYYSLMFTAAVQGGMIFKPALMVYPTEVPLHVAHSSDNFMIGDALLVHPVLTEGAVRLSAYFPNDLWYDFHTGAVQEVSDSYAILQAATTDPIPMHIRGGYIVPRLDLSATAMSTTELRASNITLVIAPDSTGNAAGYMILDDGLNPDSIAQKLYTRVNYTWAYTKGTAHTLTIAKETSGYTRAAGEFPYISNITVLGCTNPITIVTENGHLVATKLTYDSTNKVGNVEFLHAVAPDAAAVFDINF